LHLWLLSWVYRNSTHQSPQHDDKNQLPSWNLLHNVSRRGSPECSWIIGSGCRNISTTPISTSSMVSSSVQHRCPLQWLISSLFPPCLMPVCWSHRSKCKSFKLCFINSRIQRHLCIKIEKLHCSQAQAISQLWSIDHERIPPAMQSKLFAKPFSKNNVCKCLPSSHTTSLQSSSHLLQSLITSKPTYRPIDMTQRKAWPCNFIQPCCLCC
jgi:hypothetical protein